ncbi:MAG: hypothetical protein KY463_06445 [Actinobacteria bacterium]|nr:hypothetical protein [Actinomycetota bacterium]
MTPAALVVLLACVAATAPAAHAAPEVVVADGDGVLMAVAAEPGSGRSIAITGRAAPDGNGFVSLDLFASPLDAAGRPAGPKQLVGGGMKPDFSLIGGAQLSVATDTKRRRHLVAWSAHKPGMGRTACPPSGLQPSLMTADLPPCFTDDTEIFVRVVERTGRARGPERPVTNVGPPSSGMFSSAGASIVYDAKTDTVLLVFAARLTGEAGRAALLAQRLRPDGTPLGPPRRLALRPQALSAGPLTRLVADPRGGHLLAYTWGERDDDRRLYARRLTPAGQPSGPTRTLSADAVGGVQLAFDRRRRRALVVYSSAVPGAENGVRARLLSAAGRPLAAAANLPYRLRAGPVVVASDPARGGWAYGFVRDSSGPARQVFVQRATSTGRPAGTPRMVSQPAHRAGEPLLASTGGGTLLVGWTDTKIACDFGGGCVTGTSSVRTRLVRP